MKKPYPCEGFAPTDLPIECQHCGWTLKAHAARQRNRIVGLWNMIVAKR